VRTPLTRLDIDDALRKRLVAGGIVDVEGVLEVTSARLTEIVGDRTTAAKLQEMAKQVLAGGAPPPPAPAPTGGTSGGLDAGGALVRPPRLTAKRTGPAPAAPRKKK
jgi:hypothetical protein